MRLRWRLRAYVVLLHVLLFAFTVALLREQVALFITVEVLLLASLAGGFVLVERALQPLEYTARFRDLLQDQEYAARMTPSGQPELDQLIVLFNTMLGTLYSERLALGEQRGFLNSLLEATPSAVIVFDFEGRISLMNASAQALPPMARQLDNVPLGESRLLADKDGRRYRAQRGQFFDRGFARDFLIVEELTDELESSERAAYEKLIRVLAHEVNNTVAATGSVLDSLLYYRGQLAERDSADFSTAIDAVKRRNLSLGEFIERFTRVIKMPAPELRPLAVTTIMNDILWLNREHCRQRGIRIGWDVCEDVAPVPMDAQLMEQALLNIVKNAVEAVEAAQAQGALQGEVRFSLVQDGARARLTVTDSGDRLGSVPERQLFTPFFTTKQGGQGIGLMFVREVLNRHGFPYRLAPGGQGETSFDIWFAQAAD